MSAAAENVAGLGDILVATGPSVAEPPTVDALAGFDVVAQFSRNLLNLEVVRSLERHGIAVLRAYTPWTDGDIPAALIAAVPPRLRLMLSAVPARLEVRLLDPHLGELRWPPDVGPSGAGPATSGRRARSIRSRAADVVWRFEVNLLIGRFDVATDSQSGIARVAGGFGPSGAGPSTSGATTPPDDGSWERLTLAVGEATTTARPVLGVPSGLWRFGIGLDCSESVAEVSSDAAGVVAFARSQLAKGLLVQALGPLRAAADLRLSPLLAPAGALTTASVGRATLPSFTVEDSLLLDPRGEPVLAVCAQLSGSAGGVLHVVPPLLDGQDFAYAVSEAVLRSAYEVLWPVVAAGMSFVGEIPVPLPVSDDPNVTATGRARVQTSSPKRSGRWRSRRQLPATWTP